jgi:hypothetical protein
MQNKKAIGALPQTPFRGLFSKSPLKTFKNFGRKGRFTRRFSFYRSLSHAQTKKESTALQLTLFC